MTSFRLSKPQRRKRVYGNKEPPFPVPIATQTNSSPSDDKWYYYTAYIVDGSIVVQHSGDVEQLYKMGFFGKGTLSRHRPQYHHMTPSLRWPVQNHQHQSLKVISRRKYTRRLAWTTSRLSNHEEEIETLPVAKKSSTHIQVDAAAKPTMTIRGHIVDKPTQNKTEEIEQCLKPQFVEINQETADEKTTLELTKEGDKDLGQGSWGQVYCHGDQDEVDPWATATQTESADFWGMPDPVKNSCGISDDIVVPGDNPLPDVAMATTIEPDSVRSTVRKESEKSLPCQTTCIQNEVLNTDTIVSGNLCDGIIESQVTQKNSETPASYNRLYTIQPADPISSTSSINSDDTKPCHVVPTKYHTNEQLRCNLDSRCSVDDENGDLLVVDDTDDSDVEVSMDTRLSWQPVVKKNPYIVRENLQLSMEEAFFLSYGLGCLVVYDENKEVLDLLALWRRFCRRDDSFLYRYVAYHNLRSKGWVPKSGLKYGTDFVVYKQGPAFYHSTYSVLVRHVRSGDLRERHDGIARENTWTSLAAINRITEQVSKELMLCYVIEPEGLTQTDKASPTCVARYTVQEVVLKRSVSKQERENPEYVLMP